MFNPFRSDNFFFSYPGHQFHCSIPCNYPVILTDDKCWIRQTLEKINQFMPESLNLWDGLFFIGDILDNSIDKFYLSGRVELCKCCDTDTYTAVSYTHLRAHETDS